MGKFLLAAFQTLIGTVKRMGLWRAIALPWLMFQTLIGTVKRPRGGGQKGAGRRRFKPS